MLRELLVTLVQPSAWRLAWRNVGRSGRRTAIVLVAIAVGLGGALLTMAVNYGMVYQMVETAIRTELGDLQLHGQGFRMKPGLEIRVPLAGVGDGAPLRDLPSVEAWAPRLRSEGLVFSPRASVGVRLVGIDPEREARVSVLESSIVSGRYLNGGRRRVLLGHRLADRLQVGVGDKIVVSAQDVHGDMTGEAFRVAGLFRTPSRDLDDATVFLRLDEGQRMLDVPREVSELVVVARPGTDLDALRARIARRVGSDFEVETWRQIRPLLVSMIRSFDQMGWIVYAAVFIAMAFGIANVLLMSIFERIREIGILLAIGMPPGRMVAVILLESWLLTLGGVLLGFALGFGAVLLLGDGIDLSAWGEGLEALGVPSRIVPVVRASDVTVPVAVATLTALVASLWPALRAVRIRPADAVRHV